MKWPPLPKVVPGPRGPITIKFVPRLTDEKGKALMGQAVPDGRTIKIRKGIRRDVAWDTLFHELCHVWTFDASPTLYDTLVSKHEGLNESIADAVALGLIHFMPTYLKEHE